MPIAVGIDISKGDFNACLLRASSEKKPAESVHVNQESHFAGFLSWARQEAKGEPLHFCMESTGGYEYPLACYLARAGELVSVENPRRIKHFGLAKGCSNKTDRVDARTIAEYALTMDLRPWHLMDATHRELSELSRHREDLLTELGRVRNRLEHKDSLQTLRRKQLEDLEELLVRQVEETETEQRRVVKESDSLQASVEALTKVKGVGFLTATVLLCEMPDIAQFDRAQTWSAQAGLFPCRRESGNWKAPSRMSKAGNAHVRRILYMGVTQAMKLHPAINALAERLKAKSRTPKQIRVACMRKLLMICYGILKAISQGKTPFYGLPPQKNTPQP